MVQGYYTLQEAAKFAIPCVRSRDGHIPTAATIIVTNYERLHLFDSSAFAGVVCDESSILKNFDGATRTAVTEFARRLPYRLLCTATPAPNDSIELGTSSEVLGEMGYTDMLAMFFKNDESSIEPMSYKTKWRFKPHAEGAFWRWLCSWARALRKPSDLGFEDGPFILPPLETHVDIVQTSRPFDGYLFVVPASTLEEQREERRATIRQRCEVVAEYATSKEPFIAWCHLNDEADLLERMIPDAQQVSGAQSDESKEERLEAFRMGQLRVLITKPMMASHGMNWQHCAHLSVFPSHSYEQYYQAIRRCWRYGQQRCVRVEVISTAGEADVLGNLRRKADAADRMFAMLVQHMRAAMGVTRRDEPSPSMPVPEWMQEPIACNPS